MARGRKRLFLIDDHSASKKAVRQHIPLPALLEILMIVRSFATYGAPSIAAASPELDYVRTSSLNLDYGCRLGRPPTRTA
jgi:hypothetical protein